MKTTANGTTAAKVNKRAQQYDEVTKVIRISFEHDGRMSAEDAREYVAERVHSYATAHAHTIDEGTHILDVEDMGEPEPEHRPTFAEAGRDEVESHYNNGDSNDETAQAIAKAISRAVADIYGKGNAARYILDAVSYHVQGHCNPALSDEDAESEDEDESEDDYEEDPTLTEAEKRDTLCRLWEAAWQQVQSDPETYRVIVETNEEDPTAPANEFGRYYMVDGSEAESGIEHAGQWVVIRVDTVTSPYEVHRPNYAAVHGYNDNQAQLACRCENPNNVTRWARLMIDAGRVTDIYADCY